MVFGIFDGPSSKERKAVKQSLIDYESCREWARKYRANFRKSATQEILFTYPDAKILMNQHHRTFIAYSKQSGIILGGFFADLLVPKVEFVSSEASIAERVMAIKTFRDSFNSASPLTPSRRLDKDRHLYFRDLDSAAKYDLVNNGFHISQKHDNDKIAAIRVKKNEKKIAESHCWDVKQGGYFTSSIYSELSIHNELPSPKENGLNVLSVDILTTDGYNNALLDYELIYDARQRFDADKGRATFNALFSGVAGFLSYIEPELRTPPNGCTGDREEWELLQMNLEFTWNR